VRREKPDFENEKIIETGENEIVVQSQLEVQNETANMENELQVGTAKISKVAQLKKDFDESDRKQQLEKVETSKNENQFPQTQMKAKVDFSKSHFRANYSADLAPRYPQQVLSALRQFIVLHGKLKNLNEQELTEFFDKLQKEVFDYKADLIEKSIWICMKLWTANLSLNGREFCSILNESIREDIPVLVQLALPLIAGLNELCVERKKGQRTIQWPADHTLYRGAGLPVDYQHQFKLGLKYRCPMYLSTSTNKLNVSQKVFCHRAQLELNLPPVLYIIRLNSQLGCCHVNYIEKTNIEGESEFLFVPYSVFTVLKVDWKAAPTWIDPHVIELEAAVDNQLEPEDLPLIYWH